MRRGSDGQLILAATDLVSFLECGHLTNLNRALLAGLKSKPDVADDPGLDLLRRRGWAHEERYIEALEKRDPPRRITRLDGSYERSTEVRARETEEAMRRGDDVIFQATVFDGRWIGHPDFLLRVPRVTDVMATSMGQAASTPLQTQLWGSTISLTDSAGAGSMLDGPGTPAGAGGLGRDWHYEVADTKLAHSAKASALIQMCSYVEQIERIQGVRPERAYVVTGGAKIEEHGFRTAEMMAYYRSARQRFEDALANELDLSASYPDPVEHCAVCRWSYAECRRVWREDDALPLVAGISRKQRALLRSNQVTTMTALSTLDPPIQFEGMKRSHSDSMWNMREQARLQVLTGGREVPEYELLDPDRDGSDVLLQDRGLAALPQPSEHDLFFDIEGDPFAFWEGLEYLFGVWDGAQYRQLWAVNRDEEKLRFEEVMRLFYDWWQQHPDMHVYHYGVYEPSRLKQLAGRHATMQDELDALLRGRVFVDLYRVVRQGVRVGSDRYSIKNLEPLYGFRREIALRDANSSIVEFELYLETGATNEELKESIAGYNADDCRSTQALRDWLEARRADVRLRPGEELPRPRDRDESTEAKPPTEWELQLKSVIERLTADIDGDPQRQSDSERRRWLLANMLDWHRREEKASWWRFFELVGLSDGELFEENEPIGRLRWEGVVGETKSGNKIHRYSFPAQEHRVGNRSELYDPRLPLFAEAQMKNRGVDKDKLTIDIERPPDWTGPHPQSVVPYDRIPIEGLQKSLVRFGEWVADNDLETDEEPYRAVRDLIVGRSPRVSGHTDGQPLYSELEGGSAGARRLAPRLDGTTLAIQGPPGSGKTYSGARMILELVSDPGRRRVVGITGSSHKVVTNLLQEVWDAAAEEKVSIELLQRIDGADTEPRSWATAKDNAKLEKLRASEEHDFRVIGGTVWLWAREQMTGSVDTLFVDEAGQVALANVVAAGGAARNIVLLGDPQQLDQVLQGSHPPGAAESSLGHFLGGAETLTRERGVFLEKTWRMHPQITDYTSELFYEGKLLPIDGLGRQRVGGSPDWLAGSGLRWRPVEHDGNTNASPQEAAEVVEIVRSLLGRDWIDRFGATHALGVADIRVVSPYNSHRLLIDEELEKAGIEGVQVGTVDKFQGQEAPVSIYTMATSRPEDAPRGLGFLFSLNRLNVATSRARALAIVVASPALLRVVPRTPDQLRMANGLAAFVKAAALPRESVMGIS